MQRGEVSPDQGRQYFVSSVGHEAVVLGVLDHVVSGRVLLPSIVPAGHPPPKPQSDPCSFVCRILPGDVQACPHPPHPRHPLGQLTPSDYP